VNDIAVLAAERELISVSGELAIHPNKSNYRVAI